MSPWKLLNSSPAVCLLYAERMALTTAVYAKLQLNIEVIKNVKKKKYEIKKIPDSTFTFKIFPGAK